MPVVEWNDHFLLGIQQIDQHHQHLVELLNKTYDEFTEGGPVENVELVLDELIDYATYHFACEEHWMTETSYTALAIHMDEHEKFINKFINFKQELSNESINLSEVLSFLINWLAEHILKTDANYGHFIASKNNSKQLNIKLLKRTVF